MVDIQADNEISLGGYYFPIKGPVRVTNISVTPNPVIFGDTSRVGDTQVMSQLIQASVTGGSGIHKANPRTEVERVWTSECDTRFRNTVTLPPEVVEMGTPRTDSTDVAVLVEFNNELYVAFSQYVYVWVNSTGLWSALDRTLGAAPTDAVVFKDALYMACGTTYEYRAAGGVPGTWASVAATPTAYFTVWDGLLWRLGHVGSPAVWTLYSSPDGLAWTSKGTLPSGVTPTQMLTYRDSTGSTVINVLTDSGVWIYDATNTRLLPTEVRIPRVPTGQTVRGTVFRDAKLYFSTGGLGMVGVQGGNPFIITPMGLDLDDGVPIEDDGRISTVAADFNWLLAMIEGTTAGGAETFRHALPGPFSGFAFSTATGQSSLRAWNGGWHKLWTSPPNATAGRSIVVASAYDVRRAYWGANRRAFYMNLTSTVHNPRHNPTLRFQQGPFDHVTPWFDFGSQVQKKLHGHFYVHTEGCSATEKITAYYSTDLDDDTWTLIREITTNGLHDLNLNATEGTTARFFRYKFVLERGTDPTKRPIMEFWSAEFMRLLPATYGFAVTVDLGESHRGRTPSQMLATLKDLADPDTTPQMIEFAYQDDVNATAQTHHGKISRITGSEYTGLTLRGQGEYLVSIMVPYKNDSH